MRYSLALLASAFSTLVAGQIASQSAIPDLNPPEGNCGGCYVLADVAGIVFGGVQTVTDQVVHSVGRSPNGTILTTITNTVSATATVGQFSFNPTATGGAAPPINFHDLNSTIIVGGATLTSPTQYEVFTAYSVTSFNQGNNGECITSKGPARQLDQASKYVVSADADNNFLVGLQNSFISGLGLTCSAGGGNVASTIQSMITRTTESVQTTGIVRATPVAVSLASATTARSTSVALSTGVVPSGVASASTAASTTTVIFGNGTVPTIATGSGGSGVGPVPTIAPGAGAHVAPAWVGAGCVAFGLAAILM